MTITEVALGALGGYLALGSLGTAACSRIGRSLKRTPREQTRVAQYPPPVPRPLTPPFSQTVASADWFFGVPSDCLGDDAIRALADDIERREFS